MEARLRRGRPGTGRAACQGGALPAPLPGCAARGPAPRWDARWRSPRRRPGPS
ncbi:hypothetical protein ACU4GD_24320 [Cupriavidus basilensis]